MYLRIAEPIELWDGTSGDPAADLASQADWSLYEVGTLTPVSIVASFFGNRTGHAPMRPTAYVLFTPDELLATGGTLHPVPSNFGWPPEVVAAHRDLVGHENGARALFDGYVPATRLHAISREALLAEQAVLAARQDVTAAFRTNVIKRLKRIQGENPTLWAAVVATCGNRVDPGCLTG